MALKDAKQCKAKAKNTGSRCKNPAVIGFAVCRMHGAGNKSKPGGRPIETGRYSKHLPIRLAARYKEARDDPAILELRDDVALLDVRLGELLENLQEGDTRKLWLDLGKHWHEFELALAKVDKQKQGVILRDISKLIKHGNSVYADWNEVYNVADQRRKTVESERKRLVEMQQTITAERAMLLIGAILGVIQRNVTNKETLNTIKAEFRELSMGEVV